MSKKNQDASSLEREPPATVPPDERYAQTAAQRQALSGAPSRMSRRELEERLDWLRGQLLAARTALEQSELARADQVELEIARDSYANLFDFAPVAYLELDQHGLIQGLNLTAARLFRIGREGLIRRPLLALIAKPDRRKFLNHIAQAALGRDSVVSELTVQPKDAPPVPVQITTVPAPEFPRRAVRHRTALVDLTERKKAEEALRAREADLRALNETLEQRVAERTAEVQRLADQLRALANELSQTEQRERQRLARILHDNIQQLLVAARLQLSLIKRADPAVIQSVARGVDSILAETLEASRSLTVELCPPILHQSGLAAALNWLSARMEEKQQFRVRLRTNNDAEPASPDARAFLFEATREMLLNCAKHSGTREAHLTMTRTKDDSCRIIVEDKGKGFELATSRPGPNGGFGLFSIQQRLLHLGGKLEIESARGQGTKAILTMPIGRAARAEAAPVAPAAEGLEGGITVKPKGRRINIILADDHKIMREGLSSILQFENDLEIVAEAEDGRQALEMARRHKPDVVIMDVNMPVMDGIEATRILTEEMPQTKVIALSMHTDGEAANAMREAGAVAFLTKGGPSDDLVEAIRACCRPVKEKV